MEKELIKKAKEVVGRQALNTVDGNVAGSVGAAILTKDGSIYTGISISLVCGLGFCAEASAAAEMLKNKETEIKMVVAVTYTGGIIPPCGRCREMMYQLNKNNLDADVIIAEGKIVKLKELLPELWVENWT